MRNNSLFDIISSLTNSAFSEQDQKHRKQGFDHHNEHDFHHNNSDNEDHDSDYKYQLFKKIQTDPKLKKTCIFPRNHRPFLDKIIEETGIIR